MTTSSASLDDAQFQYVTGQGRPGFATLLPDFEARSAAVAAAAGAGTLDIRYGEAARETFDFFPANGAALGLLVYFHAGYWQSRDKSSVSYTHLDVYKRQGQQRGKAGSALAGDVLELGVVQGGGGIGHGAGQFE